MKPVMFQDEFEYNASDDCTYDVSVKIKRGPVYGKIINELIDLTVSNHLGDEIDDDHPMYEEIKVEATDREYELETHDVDYDFYNINLGEK